jgi:hypothetical protein
MSADDSFRLDRGPREKKPAMASGCSGACAESTRPMRAGSKHARASARACARVSGLGASDRLVDGNGTELAPPPPKLQLM